MKNVAQRFQRIPTIPQGTLSSRSLFAWLSVQPGTPAYTAPRMAELLNVTLDNIVTAMVTLRDYQLVTVELPEDCVSVKWRASFAHSTTEDALNRWDAHDANAWGR